MRWLTHGFAALARVLPLRRVQGIGNVAGWLIYHGLGARRRLALENLRRVLGDRLTERERRRVALASVRNMAKTMLELLKLPAMSEQELAAFASVRGEEHLERAVERGKGVVVVTPHFGNWEILAARLAQMGYGVSVVARDANDPVTARVINRCRESASERVLERDQVREMLHTLREGELLGILPDQHGGEGGIWIGFMGHPASTVTGPASLAAHTGAAIVAAFARRTEDEHIDIYVLPPLHLPDTGDRQGDVRRTTQMINDVFGEEIRAHPEQWLWMHKRWRTPPPDVDIPEPVAT
ncbi:MAG: lysophospholipid acyltransferase family protein [Armatimonadota bacterium]|nr:lysophospholipid acyltransferase family protein [Armatimonadota bacterium]